MRYFSFTVGASEWERWGSILPIPSFSKVITSHLGEKIQVAYELKYQPSSYENWYFVADLKRSYEANIAGVKFYNNVKIEGDGWATTGYIYILTQLKMFPTDGASYPYIFRWPTSKRNFRSRAFLYAVKLKYEKLLSYESIMATTIAMNNRFPIVDRLKVRTLNRLCAEIMFHSEKWTKVRLDARELKKRRLELGVQRGVQRTETKNENIRAIVQAIETGAFSKPNGSVNKTKLAEHLGIDRRTVFNLLPLLVGVMVMLLWIRTTYTLPPFREPDNISGMEYLPHTHHLAKSTFPLFLKHRTQGV